MNVKINNNRECSIEFDNSLTNGKIDNKDFEIDAIKVKENTYHILKDSNSFTVEVVKKNYKEKKFDIKVGNTIYQVKINDKIDEVLKQLGMDKLNDNKVKEIKAPMPGLVLDVMIEEGSKVCKGEPLFVLEAMKMENVLKSPSDGIIHKVYVNKNVVIEKDQLLVHFK